MQNFRALQWLLVFIADVFSLCSSFWEIFAKNSVFGGVFTWWVLKGVCKISNIFYHKKLKKWGAFISDADMMYFFSTRLITHLPICFLLVRVFKKFALENYLNQMLINLSLKHIEFAVWSMLNFKSKFSSLNLRTKSTLFKVPAKTTPNLILNCTNLTLVLQLLPWQPSLSIILCTSKT